MAPSMISEGGRATRVGVAEAGLDPRVLQDALHHLAEPLRFGLQQLTVALHAIAADHAMRKVVRGRANHRDRRAQLVRDTGDELHLLTRETLRAS